MERQLLKPVTPGLGISTIILLVKVGAVNEGKKEERGMSHFIEHLMFHTAKKALSQGDGNNRLVEAFNIMGNMNAYTTHDHTAYHISVPDRKLREAIHLLLKTVFQSHITQKDVDDERQVVLEEYNNDKGRPDWFADEVVYDVYKGHPLSNRVIGGESYIRGYTLSRIQRFVNRFYTFENSILTVCSDVSQTLITDTIDKCIQGGCRLNGINGPAGEHKLAPLAPLAPKAGGSPHIRVFESRLEPKGQSGIVIVFPVATNNDLKRCATIKLLTYIIGGSNMSELFRILRLEHNLVYGASCGYQENLGGGAISCYCQVNPSHMLKALEMMIGVLIGHEWVQRFDVYRDNFINDMESTYKSDAVSWALFRHKRYFVGNGEISWRQFQKVVKSIGVDDVKREAVTLFKFDGRTMIGLKHSGDSTIKEKVASILEKLKKDSSN